MTDLRHIWRTKFLFANILDRANCSCLFTSTSISPQVSPKTLKHSAKLSELFSGRSFSQQFLSFAKSDEENLRSTSFAKKYCRRWKVANHYCVSQIPTNKMYAVGFTVTKSFVAHYRAKFSIAICCERFGKFIE